MKKIILIVSISLSLSFSVLANTNKEDKELCSGFGKWTKEGEFKININELYKLNNSWYYNY